MRVVSCSFLYPSATMPVLSSSLEYSVVTFAPLFSRKILFSVCSKACRVVCLFFGKSSHPQIVIVCQPRWRSWMRFSMSRCLLRSIFFFQNGVLLLGNTKYLQPSWPCQKQPLMKMTVLYLRSTMSGVPGRRLTFMR